MDPLKHMSLLRELGVDWYVPKAIFVSQPQQIDRITMLRCDHDFTGHSVVSNNNSNHVSVSSIARSFPKLDIDLDGVKDKIENNVKPKAKPIVKAKELIPSFNLLVARSASLVFVTDVKANPLTAVWERSVRQFFDEIETSCGLDGKKVQSLDYFSWPIAGSANVNLGEDQLIQLLAGFMRQRILGDKKGVILFGDNAKQYGTSVVSDINNLQVIAASSLGVMFTSVAAKAALWRDLQALPIGKG
jgi:hypothetical protein